MVKMDEESTANLTRIDANLRECDFVDGNVAMDHRHRSLGRSTRCTIRWGHHAPIRANARPIRVDSRSCFSRRSNRPALILFSGEVARTGVFRPDSIAAETPATRSPPRSSVAGDRKSTRLN